MRERVVQVALVALLAAAGFRFGQASEIGWPEAVARLAGERTKAETCVGLLQQHGDAAQKSRGQLFYAAAKADSDAVIAGLLVVLAQKGTPESLPSLEVKLERSAAGLWEFCKTVSDLTPSTAGQRNVLVDIAKATIEPLVNSLIAGVAELYNNYGKAEALTRATIQTQLEAARWPAFAEVKAAQ